MKFKENTMKINFTKLLAPALLLGSLLFSSMAMAQSPYYQNNRNHSSYNHQYDGYRSSYYTQKRTMSERFLNQRARIADGQRDGSLTWRESTALKNKLSSLERELALTARVGYITPAQYSHFEFELDQMSRVIYNAKHNSRGYYNQPDNYGYRGYSNRQVDRRYYR
jgi:hypothetical protein